MREGLELEHLPADSGSERSVEERRAELMDRLDYKVEAVLDLGKKIIGLDDAASSVEAHRVLDESWSAARDMFPPQTIEQFDQLTEIRDREKQLYTILSESLDAAAQPIDEPAMKKLQADLQTLRSVELPLLEIEDLQFLLNIENVVTSLKRKNNVVEELRDQPDKILGVLNTRRLQDDVAPSDVVRIEQKPFEFSIVLKSKSYQRVLGPKDDTLGVHFEHSPFSLIRHRPDEQKTIGHETVHNIIDQVTGISSVDRRVHQLNERYQQASAPEEKKAIEESLLTQSPASLVNSLHNEIVADFENWENKPWNLAESKKPSPQIGPPKTFDFHAGNYSTAGFEAREIAQAFKAAAKKSRDPERRRSLEQTGKDFEGRFVRALEHMRAGLKIAQHYGPRAFNQLHALLFVLPPSRYRHIEDFFLIKYEDQGVREFVSQMGKNESSHWLQDRFEKRI